MATFPSMPHIAHASYGGSLCTVENCHLPTEPFNSRERELLYPLTAKISFNQEVRMAPIKRLPIAVFIFSIMLFPLNANAFWLDIVKSLASVVTGGIKEQTKATVQKNAAPVSVPSPSVDLASPENVNAALDSLVAVCRRISEKVPCAVGRGTGTNPGSALEAAHDKAIIAMGKSLGAYVSSNAEIIEKTLETDDDYKSSEEKITVSKISVEQEVKNTQVYLTYTHKIKKGSKELDEVFLVLVMDKALFERALAEASQGKPVSQQIIGESVKSVASFIKGIFIKK
jgi:hypothetical protein